MDPNYLAQLENMFRSKLGAQPSMPAISGAQPQSEGAAGLSAPMPTKQLPIKTEMEPRPASNQRMLDALNDIIRGGNGTGSPRGY